MEEALKNPQRERFTCLVTSDVYEKLRPLITGITPTLVERTELTRRFPEALHQGVALQVGPLPALNFDELCETWARKKSLVLVLDRVTDPQNTGALVRTAAAMGAAGVITTQRHSAPLCGGTLAKAASGALEHIPVVILPNLHRGLQTLKAKGFWCVGLCERAPALLGKNPLPAPLALVVGGEGAGLRPLTREACDVLVRIPTSSSFPTLNVTTAAAMGLYVLKHFAAADVAQEVDPVEAAVPTEETSPTETTGFVETTNLGEKTTLMAKAGPVETAVLTEETGSVETAVLTEETVPTETTGFVK